MTTLHVALLALASSPPSAVAAPAAANEPVVLGAAVAPVALGALGAPVAPVASELLGVLPRGITSFGADALDGWLYVHGGYHGKPHAYSREGQSGEFYRIDLRDGRVLEHLDAQQAMQSAPLVACDGKLVRAGGMVARNAQGEPAHLESLASVSAYDPVARAWTKLPDMPRGRSSHDLECVGRRLVVVGGWSLSGAAKGEFATSALVLDLADMDRGWKEIEAPFRARALAAARLGARVAVVGGIDADGEVVADVRVLDVESGTWSDAPAFPGEAFGVSAASVDGVVFASGKDGAVWRLAQGDRAWTRVAELAFPRFFHQLVATESGGLVCVGGIDDMRREGRVRHIERVELAGDPRDGASRLVTLMLPAPLAARNRSGVLARGSSLLLFGGNRSLKQHDFAPADFSDEAWELDLATLRWRERARIPEARQTCATLTCGTGTEAGDARGDVGLVVGGFAHDGEAPVSRRAGFRYSFEEDAWAEDASLELDVPRTQLGLAPFGGDLWVFGGMDYDPRREGDAFRLPLDVLVARRGETPARFEKAGIELTTPRRAFACAVMAGKAYLVGGMRERFALVESCEAFDFETRAFVAIARPSAARVSATLVGLGGKLYLVGGSSKRDGGSLAPDRTIEVYDTTADRWSTLPVELPEGMEHVFAFPMHGRLVVGSTHVEGEPAIRLCFVNP